MSETIDNRIVRYFAAKRFNDSGTVYEQGVEVTGLSETRIVELMRLGLILPRRESSETEKASK